MKLSQKISVALLSLVMLSGASAGAGHQAVHASHVHAVSMNKVVKLHHHKHNKKNLRKQQKAQNQPNLIHKVNQKSNLNNKINNHKNHQNNSWFKDGLSHRNLAARNWVTYRESGHNWYVSNGRCVGYFQLSAAYLGYRHGHLNMAPKHQVKVGDAYAASRYGSWVNAKSFWQAHHWY